MDTRVVLAGSSLTASAPDGAWCAPASRPTATPQAQASSKAMDAAFDVVGTALGAFLDALN